MNVCLAIVIFFWGVSALFAEIVTARPVRNLEYDEIMWYPNPRRVSTNPDALSVEEQVILQIYLDELNFGPGKIDGALGEFSKYALIAYYKALGIPELNTTKYVLQHAFRHKNIPYIKVLVPDLARRYVNSRFPHKYAQMAQFQKANYRSYNEFVSERYHTSVKFLTTLNGAAVMKKLGPGSEIIVPNVRPFFIEDLEDRRFSENEESRRHFAIVDTQKNVMHIYREYELLDSTSTRLVAFFPITSGRKSQIRYGEWTVKNAITYPTWRYDPKVLKGVGRSRDQDTINVPPGPNSPVGVMWNGLSARSVGIHGTNNPDTIGRATSSGCIRMANWDVVRLPNFLRPGCRVVIQ